MEIWLKGFQCERCGHQWKPRKDGIPKKCPHCDSSNWQTPKDGSLPPTHNGERRVPVEATPVKGIPAKEFARRLKGLEWPDEDFADDLEKAMKDMRSLSLRKDLSWPN